MQVILIHGMGRTPLSMLRLRQRLRADGHRARLFGYSPTFERLEQVTDRLVRRLRELSPDEPYALVGHSLGTVIIRNALTRLAEHPPAACFFLAPPLTASRAARHFSKYRLYRLLTGEMGQCLADEAFMDGLPLPDKLRVYAGTAGPRHPRLPFGDEANDGLVTLSEASGEAVTAVKQVDALHTFIMNSSEVIADILEQLRALENDRC